MRITVNISDNLEKDIRKFFGNKVLDMVGKIKIDPNISKEIEIWREDNHSQIDESDEKEERHIWYKLGMKSVEHVWDNDADAVYDNWRDMHNVSKR